MRERRRALVTGATGFIGGRVVHCLTERGWAVHALARPTSQQMSGLTTSVYDGSFASVASALSAAKPDVVFHLAAGFRSSSDPSEVDRLVAANVLLPAQLAEAMIAAHCLRLVNTGSFWQRAGDDHSQSFDLYAATKTAAEAILRYHHEAYGLSCITLRLYDTFGARDRRGKIVSLLIEAALSGRRLELSPGEQILDLTHVDDIARAFALAGTQLLERKDSFWHEEFVSGERMTLRQLAALVERVADTKISVDFGARPYRQREIMEPVSPATVTKLVQWKRERSLESFLRDAFRSREG